MMWSTLYSTYIQPTTSIRMQRHFEENGRRQFIYTLICDHIVFRAQSPFIIQLGIYPTQFQSGVSRSGGLNIGPVTI